MKELKSGWHVLLLGVIIAVVMIIGQYNQIMHGSDQSEFSTNVEEFNTAWNKFYRKLHGCPALAIRIEECNETQAMVDLKLWKEVVKKIERLR